MFFFLATCLGSLFGQSSFKQVGNEIYGNPSTYLGGSVALSGDGRSLAVSTYLGQYAAVYDLVGSVWVQRGSNISGSNLISLSSDGTTLAVVETTNRVRVFVWNGSAWVQRGADFTGPFGSLFSSVSFSSDGTSIAIAQANAFSGDLVKTFVWNGSSWLPRGNNISSEFENANGGAVSLSSDGNIVAIGATGKSTNAGAGQIYEWSGGSWVQRGVDITGVASSQFGKSIGSFSGFVPLRKRRNSSNTV